MRVQTCLAKIFFAKNSNYEKLHQQNSWATLAALVGGFLIF